ncbi:mechanosensitive ion channel family protein [candidate division CSSED10-310 bacterium]|uniref:Mechanosensitive ion channel family protein n=1 Tax=candidate division CSSED10-310 bacterium TaxID=2855610 RepID=A0ABV6Z0K8_UNCC1
MKDVEQYYDKAIEMIMEHGPRIILAFIVLIVGLLIIKLVVRALKRAFERSNVDQSLKSFLKSLVSILLKALLFISVASMIGIATTSFVAIIGAAGLAVGLALQGSLANFAGGVLILLFKPYKVGDFIEAQGHAGTVHEIQVFNTVVKTPDNKTIIIPNGPLSGGSITNYSTEEERRVDMTFGIGYNDDLLKAKTLLETAVQENNLILAEPPATIVVSELADSSVNFAVRVWCKSENYWKVFFGMTEKIKLLFDREGISIPFPQRDIHIFQEK